MIVAQASVINDPDGWTNVRALPNSNSRIVHILKENEVFWLGEPHQVYEEWISVYVPKNSYTISMKVDNDIIGYIHHSRISRVESLNEVTDSTVRFNYKISEFDPEDKIIDTTEQGLVYAINGRPIWGTDGDVPRFEVNNVSITINYKTMKVHPVLYEDLYEWSTTYKVFENNGSYLIYHRNRALCRMEWVD
jgi:hypothetical protein